MENDFEVRGWEDILKFLGVKDRRTGIKILKARGILLHENGKPILNKEVYKMSSYQNHIDPEEKK